jgi:hypothetical protein
MVYEYSGVIHIHSDYSDGRASYAVIIAAARDTGLDYILMSDHDTLAPQQDGREGWFGRTLVVVGGEVSPPHNHYLAFGVEHLPDPRLQPQAVIDAVRGQGGIGFIAHPADRPNRLLRLPGYGWEDWSVEGFAGIELWNFISGWAGYSRNLPRLLRATLFPRRINPGPEASVLAAWDELGSKRRVVGIGGVDAHAFRFRLGRRPVSLLSHAVQFGTVRTNVLLEEKIAPDPAAAKRQLLAALQRGHCYVFDAYPGDARGFSFTGTVGRSECRMGDEAEWQAPAVLRVSLPAAGTIVLKCGGNVCGQAAGRGAEFAAEGPGVYRVEVYCKRGKKLKPWIFSNPLYLRAGKPE